MKEMTLKEAVEAVKELFDVCPFDKREKGKSFYISEKHGGATFFFDKRQYWRGDVISKLLEYLRDKYIVDGQCRIDNITILLTKVYLEPVGWDKTIEDRKASDKEFCNNFEKYRDREYTRKDGSKIKLKDISDNDVQAVIRKKLAVRTIQDYRMFQGELIYRMHKGIWNPSE